MGLDCETFVRERITELRLAKGVSEHKMSLDLGKSGSYIRGITNGMALPSLREFFNICEYFDVTPAEFFAPIDDTETGFARLYEQIRTMSDADLEKVTTFVGWIGENHQAKK